MVSSALADVSLSAEPVAGVAGGCGVDVSILMEPVAGASGSCEADVPVGGTGSRSGREGEGGPRASGGDVLGRRRRLKHRCSAGLLLVLRTFPILRISLSLEMRLEPRVQLLRHRSFEEGTSWLLTQCGFVSASLQMVCDSSHSP